MADLALHSLLQPLIILEDQLSYCGEEKHLKMSRITSDEPNEFTDSDGVGAGAPPRNIKQRISGSVMSVLIVITIVAAYFVGLNILDNFVFAEAAPTQPINFSHKIHATDNEVPCRFCHIYAGRSFVAGIPPLSRCIGCHSAVRLDSLEIQKLTGYWERQEPVPWIKIHDLPDFVQFPHKRHIKAGVDCQEDCHGPIATQPVVTKTAPLMMGWCLACHRTKSFTGPDGKERQGPTDCWTCHI